MSDTRRRTFKGETVRDGQHATRCASGRRCSWCSSGRRHTSRVRAVAALEAVREVLEVAV